MYAIVKSGGKQYRVEQGQRLLVERLAAQEGGDVELEPVMYRSDEVVFDSGALKDVTVTARVVAHVRGEKLRVFKFKPKRGYKRRTGHRQDLTQIEVTEIAHGKKRATAKAVPAKGAAEEPQAAAAPAAAKPAAKARPPKAARAKAGGADKPEGEKARTAKPAAAKRAPKAKEKPEHGS